MAGIVKGLSCSRLLKGRMVGHGELPQRNEAEHMSQQRSTTGPTTRTRMTRLGGVLVVSALVTVGCSSPEKPRPLVSPDQSMQELETIIRQRVDSGRSQGIVAGMVFPDGSRRVVAYGAGMDASSVFEIGSITKTFTATVLSDMVRRGEVRLSDPVAGLLPAGVSVPSLKGRQITLEDLATHTSGLHGTRPTWTRSIPTTPTPTTPPTSSTSSWVATPSPVTRVQVGVLQRRLRPARPRPGATGGHELRGSRGTTRDGASDR